MARSNLGAALSRAGLYEEAIVEYNKALESQPGNVPVRLNLALAYYKSTEILEAAAEAARVVKQQPSNQQATLLLADCYLRLGENKKVIEIAVAPGSPIARRQGAHLHAGHRLDSR